MDRELHVLLAGDPDILVGRLWARVRGARESASFEYAPAWLARSDTFPIDAELPLGTGRTHTERPLFNAFMDPAPDRWGQTLLRRHERARAKAAGRAPRTLFHADFLALVDDETRLGALRFRDPGATTFSTEGSGVPPLVQLPRLLRAASAVIADEERDEDLALLLAPGTSLGGARPKASVRRPDGTLAIAKFPSKDDEWPVTTWEATTLALARSAGIVTPRSELVAVARRPVLVVDRFDRDGVRRHPYMSALTALAARDGDVRSYVEIADAIRAIGNSVRDDLAQLWRRVVFNILASNTDDHLRNHGFLRARNGWALSPAFDLNPMPVDVRPRVHALAIDEVDQTSSIELAMSVAASFGLAVKTAKEIVRGVERATRSWRTTASKHGLTKAQIERMASAFEHDERARAAK